MSHDRNEAARGTDWPEPGYFSLRLVKGGPMVGAELTYAPPNDPETGEPLDRSYYWSARIDGEHDPSPEPMPSERVMRVWLHGRRIDKAEYDYLTKDAEWARRFAPDDPRANPRQKVDIRVIRPLF